MSQLADVAFISRIARPDARGWFLKVIYGNEAHVPTGTGEVYVVTALPGQVRGNHYHPEASEWFTVISGTAQLYLCDVATGETQQRTLDTVQPVTVYVPAGVAHAFKNPEDAVEPAWLVVYADRAYDPKDTVPYELI
jgi:UDP-2-acetamido-2,6-beta-L-arabino-hexul-4-ose reductase